MRVREELVLVRLAGRPELVLGVEDVGNAVALSEQVYVGLFAQLLRGARDRLLGTGVPASGAEGLLQDPLPDLRRLDDPDEAPVPPRVTREVQRQALEEQLGHV